MSNVFSESVCLLGEGPLWHPKDQALYWFDILGKRLYRHNGTEETFWEFDEHVSAAGWVDAGQLLIASETGLSHFDVDTGESSFLQALEIDNAITRSNDGRADPWGGFWIGTMGKNQERQAGAIYRYHEGALHRLFDKITISNAICFAPDRGCAYFTDTPTRQIQRASLDDNGFPDGAPEVFLDLRGEALNPDGAVVDAEGRLWVAQWGASRVACYSPSGAFEWAVTVAASQTSCPAFGGPNLDTLFVTTAATDLDPATAHDGKTFGISQVARGQQEHQVIL